MQQKPNLDMLRSIAVLLVLLDHVLLAAGHMQLDTPPGSWPVRSIGFFGVYIFFIHTSLVLMWSLERRPHTLEFYVRRIFRIYPLAVVAILLVVVFRLPFSMDPTNMYATYRTTAYGLLSNLLLVQNIAHGGGYVLVVLWTLCLEVDMYILLPFLFFYVRRNFVLWPLLVAWALACGLGLHELGDDHVFATVVPCFLPGVMAYVLYARVQPKLPAWLLPVFVAAVFAGYMRFHIIVAAWPACLVMGLGLPYFRQLSFAPLLRLTHELAKYSYSVYLSHIFALGISFYILHLHPVALQIALGLALTAIFSFAGYHLVEAPMIRLGSRIAARWENVGEAPAAA